MRAKVDRRLKSMLRQGDPGLLDGGPRIVEISGSRAQRVAGIAAQAEYAERHQLAVVGNAHRGRQHGQHGGVVRARLGQLQGRDRAALVQRLQEAGIGHGAFVGKTAMDYRHRGAQGRPVGAGESEHSVEAAAWRISRQFTAVRLAWRDMPGCRWRGTKCGLHHWPCSASPPTMRGRRPGGCPLSSIRSLQEQRLRRCGATAHDVPAASSRAPRP